MKLTGGGKAREGRDYILDLAFCLEFALANRVVREIQRYCPGAADWQQLINHNHNHAELKDGLWIHRKGATHVKKGMLGVIPGNMRDGSFIVEGKGNLDALCSSSYGAGRVLGRNAAKQQLKLREFIASMTGIVAKVDQHTLDEAPLAYNDIFAVMQ